LGMELIAKNTMEQPTLDQIIMKNINTLTPNNKILPTTKGNELNLPFILFFSLGFLKFFFSSFSFWFIFFHK